MKDAKPFFTWFLACLILLGVIILMIIFGEGWGRSERIRQEMRKQFPRSTKSAMATHQKQPEQGDCP